MNKIFDYKCTFQNDITIDKNILDKEGIIFPNVYFDYEMLLRYAKLRKTIAGVNFVELPFCHTIEAEVFGAIVNYGDENAGPRVNQYVYKNVEDILKVQRISFDTDRVLNLIKVIKTLNEDNEDVVYEISGPFTIINNLVDSTAFFKQLRRNRQLVKELYGYLGNEIYRFAKVLIKNGVRYLSLADPMASVSIVGDKIEREYVEGFLFDFVNELVILAKENCAQILLCPKLTFVLYGMDLITFHNVKISKEMQYFQALKEVLGKVYLTGQMCIKNREYILKSAYIKELVIK